MSLEIIRIEIQKRQTRIQSLSSEIIRTQTELEEMIYEERRIGQRLGSSMLQRQINEAQSEISSLHEEIDDLISQAKEEEAKAAPTPEFNPLEMLGISALMRADGKMSDEQFNAILEQVRSAFKKG
jgi:predicted RNase H-like nuclease (RuvC/YqgF family)